MSGDDPSGPVDPGDSQVQRIASEDRRNTPSWSKDAVEEISRTAARPRVRFGGGPYDPDSPTPKSPFPVVPRLVAQELRIPTEWLTPVVPAPPGIEGPGAEPPTTSAVISHGSAVPRVNGAPSGKIRAASSPRASSAPSVGSIRAAPGPTAGSGSGVVAGGVAMGVAARGAVVPMGSESASVPRRRSSGTAWLLGASVCLLVLVVVSLVAVGRARVASLHPSGALASSLAQGPAGSSSASEAGPGEALRAPSRVQAAQRDPSGLAPDPSSAQANAGTPESPPRGAGLGNDEGIGSSPRTQRWREDVRDRRGSPRERRTAKESTSGRMEAKEATAAPAQPQSPAEPRAAEVEPAPATVRPPGKGDPERPYF